MGEEEIFSSGLIVKKKKSQLFLNVLFCNRIYNLPQA